MMNARIIHPGMMKLYLEAAVWLYAIDLHNRALVPVKGF